MPCSVCSPADLLKRDVAKICDSCLQRLVSLGCYVEGPYDQASFWKAISSETEFINSLVEMVMPLEEEYSINIHGDLRGDWWLGPPNLEKRSSVTMSYGCNPPDGHIRPLLDAMYQEILKQVD